MTYNPYQCAHNLVPGLVFDARQRVMNHARQHDPYKNDCLWCGDGALSHIVSDYRNFYGDEIADRVWDLYSKAYPRGYAGIF
jgi:hypothetical protein